MKVSRVSIAGLMLAVCLVAVGFAALRHPTEWWASGLYLTTFVLLLFALLGALVKRGEKRLPWIGATVFGWGYFVLVLTTGVLHPPVLPTARLVYYLNSRLQDTDYVTIKGNLTGPMSPPPVSMEYLTLTPTKANPSNFAAFEAFMRFKIGHCLFTLLFALLGTQLVRVFAKPDEPTETPGMQQGVQRPL